MRGTLAPRAPCAVGTRLAEVLTPTLLVSLPQLEANEATMRRAVHGTGVRLRPHAKAHKCSSLAKWQLSASDEPPVGFCAQTVGEAEAMVRGAGATDVLLTNSVAPRGSAARLAALAAEYPSAKISALVDCPSHVAALEEAAAAAKTRLGAYVEIECGQDRCGVPAASDISVSLARSILSAPSLTWGGLHVYSGWIQHVRTAEERKAKVASGPASAARSTLDRFKAEGIDVPCVTGGGTGTFRQDLEAGTHTELQPGSYLLMDKDYDGNADLAGGSLFSQALFIHTTVISADDAAGKRVVDAGSKACDLVCGVPEATSLDDDGLREALRATKYSSGGDEHGILRGVPSGLLPVGSTLQLVPSHCDPTVNLHDSIIAVRDGRVEACWPIDARGYQFVHSC